MEKQETLIDVANSKPEQLSAEQTESLANQALFDLTDTHVSIGGKQIEIKFLFWADEMEVLRRLAPYLRMLMDSVAVGQLEEAIGALMVEATWDLEFIAVIILKNQAHKFLSEIPKDENPQKQEEKLREAVREWIRANARFSELVDLVTLQLKRNKLGESLGKLWAPGALHLKAMRILSQLESQITRERLSNSTS